MFKRFPEFSKLTLADKDAYNELIKDYPPIADISFASLMTWWNTLDSAAVSTLNGNLVISCWLPGDEEHSGLCLVGTNDVDESICIIFDHLKAKGEKPRLVHVPEFVVHQMEYHDMYKIISERDYDESVIQLKGNYPLKETPDRDRDRVQKFLEHVGYKYELKPLDLTQPINRGMALKIMTAWQRKGGVNNAVELAKDVMPYLVNHADLLGLDNVCLYINGKIEAVFLYHRPHDKQYIIASFIELNLDRKGIFGFMVYVCAKYFRAQGIKFVNADLDMGIPLLRSLRFKLGPVNYFRKYTIEPQEK